MFSSCLGEARFSPAALQPRHARCACFASSTRSVWRRTAALHTKEPASKLAYSYWKQLHDNAAHVMFRRERNSGIRKISCSAAAIPFERFDSESLKAIQEGMVVAKNAGCTEVASEHMLYGIVKQQGPAGLQRSDSAAAVLRRSGVSPEAVLPFIGSSAGDSPQEEGRSAWSFLGGAGRSSGSGPLDLQLGEELKGLLRAAANDSQETVTARGVVLAMMNAPTSNAYAVLQKLLEVSMETLELELRGGESAEGERKAKVGAGGKTKRLGKKSVLKECGTDLTEQAELGCLDPMIGRDKELDRTMRILVRRRKSNPCLLGDPGVGKTAIVEGLAQRIASGEVPANLQGKRLISLQLGLLVADTKYRGEFEERLKSVLEEVAADPRIILFIDEIHTVVGAGATNGAMDAGNLLKPMLGRGELRCIGATTLDEYRKYIEKDPALERRFQQVLVDQPTVADTVSILRGLRERYELHHGVRIRDSALVEAAVLSDRYIADRFLPDKAIDLIDEAAAKLKMEITSKPMALDAIDRQARPRRDT
mmetsp:Transcript_40638/g.96555  ORF Transcript_40638/g.96555 Transcript_40638/m.96555 type:complete len:537 (-) Transcript_40638:179-1789(-)